MKVRGRVGTAPQVGVHDSLHGHRQHRQVPSPGLAIQGLIEEGRVRRVEHHPVAAVVAQVEGLVAREQGDGPRVASGGQDPIHLAAALGHWTGPALPGPDQSRNQFDGYLRAPTRGARATRALALTRSRASSASSIKPSRLAIRSAAS